MFNISHPNQLFICFNTKGYIKTNTISFGIMCFDQTMVCHSIITEFFTATRFSYLSLAISNNHNIYGWQTSVVPNPSPFGNTIFQVTELVEKTHPVTGRE